MAAKKSTWIGGAALVGVVALGGTWLLGVSPVLDETTLIQDQKVAADGENIALEAKVARLKTASENLPALKAELAALQVGIPSTEQVDAFLEQIDGYQTAREIPVVKVEFSSPVQMVDDAAVAAAAAEAATTDGSTDTSTTTTDSGTATTDAGTTAASATDGFVAVPVTITLVGSFVSSLAFVSDLQQLGGRLFLVTEVVGTGQPEAEASGGRPATAEGDVEMQIKGNLYVLSDLTAAATDESSEASTETTLPSLDPGKTVVGSGTGS
jgi:Tfp pilus assembly protein PilO